MGEIISHILIFIHSFISGCIFSVVEERASEMMERMEGGLMGREERLEERFNRQDEKLNQLDDKIEERMNRMEESQREMNMMLQQILTQFQK